MAQKQVGSASIAIQKLYDGKSQYIFVRYSKNANGNPMVDNPTAETKYMGIYTSDKNTASTKYSDYSWTQIKGSQGDSAVSGILTDEFIAINTDSEGSNGDFSRATTGILLFEGLFENTKDWTIQVTTESGITGTYDSATASYKVTGMTVDSGTITFTAKKGAATVTKKATVQKVKAGVDGSNGTNAKLLYLSSDTDVVQFDKNDVQITKRVNITANLQNVTGTATFVAIPYVGETAQSATTLTGTGNTKTLTSWDKTWNKVVITATLDSLSDKQTIIKIKEAKDGVDGTHGKDGIAGKDGVGISNTAITYAMNTSSTTAPTSGWTTTVPTLVKGQYLWTKTIWTYTDSTKEEGYSVSYISKDGNDGTDGLAGKDGVGIASTTITYVGSTSGTTKPTSGWVSTIPTVAAGSFLWTKTVWTYTDGTTETGYSVAMMGVKGDKGDQGAQGIQGLQGPTGIQGVAGPKGIDGKTQYTHIAYSNSVDGKTDFSTSDSNRAYIGMYVDFNVNDSTTPSDYSWTLVKGADGTQGTPGKAGADGKTPYFHTAWSYSAHGTDRFTTVYPNLNLLSGTSYKTQINDNHYMTMPVPTTGGYLGNNYISANYINGTPGNVIDWARFYIRQQAAPDFQYIQANTTYTVSLWARGSGTSSIYVWSSVGAVSNPATANKTINLTNVWQLFTLTFNSASSIPDNSQIFIRTPAGSNIDICLPKLELGSTATPWMPSSSEVTTADWPSYIGQYTDFTQADSTIPSTYTWSLIRGNDGKEGEDGKDGLAGKDGVGIASTTFLYAGATSSTVAPTSGWQGSVPSLAKGQYLWTKTTWLYTDGTNEIGYSVSYIAKDGNDGEDGVAGKDGVGISKTAIAYSQSTSGVVAPSSGWTASVPTLIKGQYLWTRSVWTYTDNSTETGYSVAYNGVDGNKGDKGDSNVIGFLTNESITLQAASNGTVSDFSKGTGTFKVFDGTTNVTASSSTTFALKAGTGGTFNINASTGAYAITAMTTDTAEATFTATYKGVVIEKTLSVAKSKAGATGASSTSYWLVLSSQVLSLPKGSTSLIPSNFTITPMRQVGTAAAAAFSARIIVDETVDGNTWTNKYSGDNTGYTYTPSSTNVQSIRVQLKLNSSATVILDQKSVNIVRDGSNGTNGKDGESSHTWIRYSVNSDGNPMTTTPNADSRYIGIAITSSNIAPTSYAAYTWARIKGDGGLKTRLYTNSGANVNQSPITIYSESQSDGDIIEPDSINWYTSTESSLQWELIGSNDNPNRLQNSKNPEKWSISQQNTGQLKGEVTTIESQSVFKLTRSSSYSGWQYISTGNASLYEKNFLPNDTYTVMMRIYSSKNSRIGISVMDPNAQKKNLDFGYVDLKQGWNSITSKAQAVGVEAKGNIFYIGALDWLELNEYIAIKWATLKKGSPTDFVWTPAPEDLETPVFYGEPNLLSGTKDEVSAKVETTGFTTFDPYRIKENKTLRELGLKVGDKVSLQYEWKISKKDDKAMVYGTAQTEAIGRSGNYVDGFTLKKINFSENQQQGFVKDVLTMTEKRLDMVGIRFRIDASTLVFSVSKMKIEIGEDFNPWGPSTEDDDGIFIRKNNSLYISPSVFLNENSISFRADVKYNSKIASDQITITNKGFDAMRPLILRQPVAPFDPYPGLLWMDTSSADNYIYRWGRTPREVVDGVKYTHYAYANQLDPEIADFSIYYPGKNLIRNGIGMSDTSFWLPSGSTLDLVSHVYYPKNKVLRIRNSKTSEKFVFANNKEYIPLGKPGTVYTIDVLGFKNTDCISADAHILARPVGSSTEYTFTDALFHGEIFSAGESVRRNWKWTVPSTWTGDLEFIVRFDNNGSKTAGTNGDLYIAEVSIREGINDSTTPILPSPEDDKDNAYMNFIGTYEDKIEKDSTTPSDYYWTTLNDKENHKDSSGNKGISSENIVTVYDWGWILLTQDEKDGVPWLNNEDGSTIIDWIYQITQNTSDSSIINKVVGSEQMKDVYASSDNLNELVGLNDELASKMESYNELMQNYASQINSMYENMTEMQQTMDKFMFNIDSAGGVNIIRNSTGFQFDDTEKTFYMWDIVNPNNATVKQELGNQTLNDLGFVSGFRISGHKVDLVQTLDLPAANIEHTISVFFSKQTSGGAPNNFSIKVLDAATNKEIVSAGSTQDIPSMSKFSATFSSPTKSVKIILSLNGTNTTSNSSVLVAGAMLNIGPFPLSWQSHHEEVYSANVRMDGSGLKVFNNDYEGYNVITPKEFAGYFKNGEDYEKVFTLNKDTTEVKKLQAEERFMMKPIQIVSVDSNSTPGWAFVGYDNEDEVKWNPNLLVNSSVPSFDNDGIFWPKLKKQTGKAWTGGAVTNPEKGVIRVQATSDTNKEIFYRFGDSNRVISDNYVLYPNSDYTISVDLRANFANKTIHGFYFVGYYTTTSITGWTAFFTSPIIQDLSQDTFSRRSYSFKVPPLPEGESITRIMVGLKGGTSNNTDNLKQTDYFEFRAPKLEKGLQMTD